MTPPPFGQPPRVPPSHVPTLTEVIELGADEPAVLSLDDTASVAWASTQPAPLREATAPDAAADETAEPAVDPVVDPGVDPGLDLGLDESQPHLAEPNPPASEPGLPAAVAEPAPPEPVAPVTTITSMSPPASTASAEAAWRGDPDLPAFLLAARPATALPPQPGVPAGSGGEAASATPGRPVVPPVWPPEALPVLSEVLEAPAGGVPSRQAPAPTASPLAHMTGEDSGRQAVAPEGSAVGSSIASGASQPDDQSLPAEPPPSGQAAAAQIDPVPTALLPQQAGESAPAPAAPAYSEAWREEQIVQQVLADLQRQADAMLEFRLREALAPVLARVTDDLVRGARQELAATLRDVVARAVAQELARQRSK